MSAPPVSIRDLQRGVITKMLNQDSDDNRRSGAGGDSDASTWKVVVYDTFSRDVLAPLMKVGDLRAQGVTLHMMLHSDRSAIPDVPAIYFVLPTEENIKRIAEDCGKQLYEGFYLNFTSALPRPLLEQLATACLQTESTNRIQKVYDQHLDFVALEPSLFSLNIPNSYSMIYDQKASDSSIEASIDRVVNALFSVLVTMGVVPIIRCPRNGPSEMVAARLNQRLRDHLVSRDNLFESSSARSHRPLLVILERNMDLSIGCHHSWQYQPLVHDLLGLRANRVSVEVGDDNDPTAPKKKKTFDLETGDQFWDDNAGSPFPTVADEVSSQLASYKADAEVLYQKTGLAVDSDGNVQSTEQVGAKGLQSAVTALPELAERKKKLDIHTDIATALMNGIKERELDEYFSMEEALMTSATMEPNVLKERLSLNAKGTPADKLRLFLIYYLNNEVSASDFDGYVSQLESCGADLRALAYVKKIKSFTQSLQTAQAGFAKTSKDATPSSSFLSGIASKVLEHGKEAVEKARKWLPSDSNVAIARVTEVLLEGKPNAPENEEYAYLDPKSSNPNNTSPPSSKPQYKDAIVFMLSGANYIEHHALRELATKANKNIILGTTEVLAPEQLLKQFADLGKSEPKLAAQMDQLDLD